MIGSFLTRGLVMILGYAYPAYECYKTVEKNKPEIEQLRFWCQYWILVAVLTVFERFSDTFISWVPMYSEAKLAFVIYLWYPKTKGTSYVYSSFFRPYMAKHETEIDRNLQELRTRAGDMAFMYCQKAATYGQTRIFEILQYVATQSTPRPRPTQPQQEAPRARPTPVTVPRQASTRSQATLPQNEEPPSPTSSSSSSQPENDVEEELSSTQNEPSQSVPPPSAPTPTPTPTSTTLKKSISMPTSPPESSSQPATNDPETMQIEPVRARVVKLAAKPPTPPQDTVMEDAIRVTRGRLRKTRSTLTK